MHIKHPLANIYSFTLFGELTAIGMRQDMVDKTVDSILVKEVTIRVEITCLFQSNCLISQCCFYQKIMFPYTLKIYDFLLLFRFLSRKKFGFDLNTH